jgi:hypothetical protein
MNAESEAARRVRDNAPTERHVRISRADGAVELYFPPFRMPQVALPLAAFGAIAFAIPAAAIAPLIASALHDPGQMLTAVLIGGLVLPFTLFGVVFAAIALYMISNALVVHADATEIVTARVLLGVVVKRRRLARSEIERVEAEIASRYQSLFSSDPVYQLVARTRDRRRIVLAETLRGEAEMERVKALLENPA